MFFPLKDDNPTKNFPYMTVIFIAVNVVIYIAELLMGSSRSFFVAKYGVVPFEITRAVDLNPKVFLGPYVTLVTSLFLHGSLFHLLGNMWFLWIFGNNIEDIMGSFRFVFFYLLGGVVASLVQILIFAASTITVIGASGAVSAVLGGYILKFPRARVKTLMFIFIFITVINVPAGVFIGIWFFMQLISSVGGMASNVAWFAHIGGFLFGLLCVKLFQKKEGYKRYRVY